MTNTTINLFEEASKKKFRYPYKGWITTEDLWDLNFDQLDSIFKALNKETYDNRGASLMNDGLAMNPDTLAKIDIVKHVFNTKMAEADARTHAAEIAAQKRKIMDILAKKQDDALENMSEGDLMNMLANLG